MKETLKKMVFMIAFFLVLPLICLTRLEEICGNREGIFTFSGHLLSLLPGTPGSYIRCAYYFGTLQKCSWNFHISFGSFFSHRTAEIGQNVSIGAYCVIGTATIGTGTMLASRCSIPSGKTQHFSKSGKLTRVFTPSRVHIGSNVWIGEGAIVMDDVGDDTIVSAGSVLTQKAPAHCLMSGVPARFQRNLHPNSSLQVEF